MVRASLLTVVLAGAGCAGPFVRATPDFAQRVATIHRVGLLAPQLTVYEESVATEYVFVVHRLVAQPEWSNAAATELRVAFAAESGDPRFSPAAPLATDPESEEIADLWSVVDYSLRCHTLGRFGEAFAEPQRAFAATLGPLDAWMERAGVDAVWMIGGVNLVPTPGAVADDAVNLFLEFVAALGGQPVVSTRLEKLDVSAALVARDGTVLFYADLNEADVAGGTAGTARGLGDPAFARRVVHRLQELVAAQAEVGP